MAESRAVSLRVGRQRGCPSASRSSLDSLAGCRCEPSSYAFHRDALGDPMKGPRVRDRQTAERALPKLLVELDERRAGVGARTRKRRTLLRPMELERTAGERATY